MNIYRSSIVRHHGAPRKSPQRAGGTQIWTTADARRKVRLSGPKTVLIGLAVALLIAVGGFALTHMNGTIPLNGKKGVGTWNFNGVQQALGESGTNWYYDWTAAPVNGGVPGGVSFVPMIWGASNVTPATLNKAKSEGKVLLGFNEPDNPSQANMSVPQALDLWPQLMATGMTLGSPAVSSDAAAGGGWLAQFMDGAKTRGYRVDFIAVHWYGGDFRPGAAAAELADYLRAIHNRYHLPIWLTEFSLVRFNGTTPVFPSAQVQGEFLKAAAGMLAKTSYVQRYAWFALRSSAVSGTGGLFNTSSAPTAVGRAFKSAP